MKNSQSIVSAILAIAVIFLLYREFSPRPSGEQSPSTLAPVKAEGSLRLAYINIDSLVEHYNYHRELKEKLEQRVKRVEADLQQKSEVFQENITLLEREAPNMSDEQLQQAQMELQQTQQQLLQYRDQLTNELAVEEQELTQLLKADMDSILTALKTEQDYDFIFSFDPASSVLSANEAFNITKLVTERLNQAHQAKQKS